MCVCVCLCVGMCVKSALECFVNVCSVDGENREKVEVGGQSFTLVTCIMNYTASQQYT